MKRVSLIVLFVFFAAGIAWAGPPCGKRLSAGDCCHSCPLKFLMNPGHSCCTDDLNPGNPGFKGTHGGKLPAIISSHFAGRDLPGIYHSLVHHPFPTKKVYLFEEHLLI